jgi:hypothetical protein
VGHKLEACYDEHETDSGSLEIRPGSYSGPCILTDSIYRGHVCLRCGASFNVPPVVEECGCSNCACSQAGTEDADS